MVLTLADSGTKEFGVHGPRNLMKCFVGSRNFLQRYFYFFFFYLVIYISLIKYNIFKILLFFFFLLLLVV